MTSPGPINKSGIGFQDVNPAIEILFPHAVYEHLNILYAAVEMQIVVSRQCGSRYLKLLCRIIVS